MSKTIEQLRAQAAQIEEATRQGENTQLRVGGLFTDVIDFIAQIPITETVLGPLLQALNNSRLIDPDDGAIIAFSVLKDGWTFSDAITQLQIKVGQISTTIASNYEAFLRVKDQLQREIVATDQRVRNYKTDYDNSQIEYATWKVQTDTQISQYAVAIDKNTNQIISISGRVDTAYDQLDFVTNNLDAADKALEKLFNLNGLDYDDPDQSYTASWLYKNRQGIYGAAATFDANGNILQDSKLEVTVKGIQMTAENAQGQVSTISQTVDQISFRVSDINDRYSEIKQDVDGISATVNDPNTGIGALNVKANQASVKVTTLDKKVAELGVRAIQKDDRGIITEAFMFGDDITFQFTDNWAVLNSLGQQVMWLESNGNLHITGILDQKGLQVGTGAYKMYLRDTDNGAQLIGSGNYSGLCLGFEDSARGMSYLSLDTVTTNNIRYQAELRHNLIQIGYAYSSLVFRANESHPYFSLVGPHDVFTVELKDDKLLMRSGAWPRSTSGLHYGEVYVDGGGYLKMFGA